MKLFKTQRFIVVLVILETTVIITLALFLLYNKTVVTGSPNTIWKSTITTAGDLAKVWDIQKQHTFGMENLSIQNDPTGTFKKVIRIFYPKGSSSPSFAEESGNPIGGTQFIAKLHIDPTTSLHLRYFVRFGENFDFVKGGKLPGLYGGDIISGGNIPDGTNGFSTRFMWREKGLGELDVYLPKSPKYGAKEGTGSFLFKPGIWYSLEQEVSLNTPKKANGTIKVWVNEKQVMEVKNLTLRTTDMLQIEGIFFSTFFGGHEPSWASVRDTYADFAGFSVSKKYIGSKI